jgi:hypothetical protein
LTGGPARFTQNFTSSVLLGNAHTKAPAYTYGTITLYGAAFQRTSTSPALDHSATSQQPGNEHTPQPPHSNPCQVYHYAGLASSAFARHYSRTHNCFLFLWVLRCFTSPRSLHTPYFIQARVTGHDSSQVSPFGHPRINARLPTPQGLSQAPTSFIGSRCQGIHHMPFTACHTHHQPNPHHQPPKKPAASRNRNQASSAHTTHKQHTKKVLRTRRHAAPHSL